ncbi:hypothetical protein [Streptomyces mirabilis]
MTATNRPGGKETDTARLHGLLVVLDDDHGVATVPQPRQCLGEPSVVALVRPDARFVQHVQHADRTGADPGGRPDPLRLAAKQTGGGPVQ